MTVQELIEVLKELPQQSQVIMSRDAEGNNFETLCSVEKVQTYEDDDGLQIADEDEIRDDPDYPGYPLRLGICLWP